MRVLLSTYESRGDVEPIEGRAAQPRVFGAKLRVCAAESADARSDTVAVVAGEYDAPVAIDVMSTGGWR